MMKDYIQGIGKVVMTATNVKTGEVVNRWEKSNLVVTLGLTNLTKLLAGDVAGLPIAKIGVGSDGTAPALANTTLTNLFIKAISGYSYINATTVEFETTIEASEANGLTIREGGLFTTTPVLFSRVVRADLVKTNLIAVNIKWQIKFS